MKTTLINTLIGKPSVLLLTFFAEPLAGVAFAYWLVWLVMRPKSNEDIHTPFSWHLYGIATSLVGSAIFRIIAIATFAGRDAYTGDKTFYYLLIVPAIIAALYIHWLKQETLKKSTNTDWKETKPQNTSEKTEFIPPSRIYETEKTESIPSSYIYEIISGEMERKEYKKGLATRAFAEANGDKELAKSLYIKFRYAELFSEMELERKEKQRQQQMEDERIERERTETQRQQQIEVDCIEHERAEKQRQQQMELDRTKIIGIFSWVILIGILVASFIWFLPASVIDDFMLGFYHSGAEQGNANAITALKKLEVNTPNSTRPNTQATPAQDILQRAENLYKQERYAEALPLYQGLAEQGDAGAQYSLGFMYENGQGVAQNDTQAVFEDYNQAVFWYRKAAEQGNANAIAALKKLGQ